MNENRGHLSRANAKKGAYFALATAVISGFSIYINKFAVVQMTDPFVFTTIKNLAVALLLFAFIMLPRALPELRSLSRKDWLTLGFLGAIGGSIPFLLFFKGLSLASAPSAAFIHKTLFIWVTILAVAFLGERPGKLHVAALGMLVLGNLVLIGGPGSWAIGQAEVLIFGATIFWAVEAIVAKRVMRRVSPNLAAFGRMSFGAVVMLAYLASQGSLNLVTALTGQQIAWVVVTAAFLLGYVSCYYTGLKHAPASVVASILVLGSVITSLLYAVIDARKYSLAEIIGMLLVGGAAVVLWYVAPKVKMQKEASTLVPVEK